MSSERFKRIGNFARVRRGASPRPIDDPKYFGGEVGWVRIADVTASNKYLRTTTQYVSELGEKNSVRVDKGDLIMSICGTIGRPVIIDMPACIHDGFVQLYDIKDSDTEFLYYSLQFAEEALRAKGQSGTQTNLNTSIVSHFEIFHPSRREQEFIASVLSSIDSAIEQTEDFITKQQRVKTGLMQDLLTKGLDAQGNIRSEETHEFKHSRIGTIPKDWDVKSLGDVGRWFSGGTPSKSEPRFWDGSIPWISSKNMKQFYITESTDYLTAEGAKGIRLVPENTILIVVRGMVLAHTFPVSITTKETAFNQDLKACACNPEVSPSYLAYLLISRAQNLLRLTTEATHGTKRLDSKDLFAFEFALPQDDEEQSAIVKIIETYDARLATEQNKLSKLTALKRGLMQDLLTGKMSVQGLLGPYLANGN